MQKYVRSKLLIFRFLEKSFLFIFKNIGSTKILVNHGLFPDSRKFRTFSTIQTRCTGQIYSDADFYDDYDN